MEISNSSIEAIQKAIADHQFKSEFLSNVRQLVPLLNERDASRKIEQLQSFLQTYVVEHFALEEKTVFPLMLSACSVQSESRTAELIARLQADHVVLLGETTKLQAQMAQPNLISDPAALLQLEQSFRGFFGQLQRHAGEEDKLLHPLLAQFASQRSRP
jgi:hemerythrin-like domain-containing protein